MTSELEPIPFVGWVQHSDDTVTQVKTEFDKGYEFGVKEQAERIALLEKRFTEELNAHHSGLRKIAKLKKQTKPLADRIAELEKDLHMIQRHNDQLDNDIYTVCLDCNKKVTGDSIHTCLPRTKPRLSDEEINQK